MNIEDIEKERSSVTSVVIISMLVLMGVNECTYQVRNSSYEKLVKSCMEESRWFRDKWSRSECEESLKDKKPLI